MSYRSTIKGPTYINGRKYKVVRRLKNHKLSPSEKIEAEAEAKRWLEMGWDRIEADEIEAERERELTELERIEIEAEQERELTKYFGPK